jgi:hypothetical protein
MRASKTASSYVVTALKRQADQLLCASLVNGWSMSVQSSALPTAVGKHSQMKHLDRRVSVAPMMDYTYARDFS